MTADIIDAMKYWQGEYVQLPVMLDARERRVWIQQKLLSQYHLPLLCFTMNIAGPVKNNELIRRGFRCGAEDFHLQMQRVKKQIVHEEIQEDLAGNEAYFVCDMDPYELKKLTCELEDRDEQGRLYDMDVLYLNADGNQQKIDREEVGGHARRCLICGKPGKDCSSRRLHSVAELQQKTAAILLRSTLSRQASVIAEYAERALLYEVAVTPKPGLVDRSNSGSHKDMDFYSFLNSSAALYPYFAECAERGQQTADRKPEETFALLREAGQHAENRMLKATGGVNTHKGAIFTLGILAAAAGRRCVNSLNETEGKWNDPQAILQECAAMTAGLTAADFAGVNEENASTIGQKLYVQYGITGVRGQMEAGLPAVGEYGLPLLKQLLSEGRSKDEAGAAVLLKMIAVTEDTSLIHRGSVAVQKKEAAKAELLLEQYPDECPDASVLTKMDLYYIDKNLSPGGSADLLAACWFLYTLEKEGM